MNPNTSSVTAPADSPVLTVDYLALVDRMAAAGMNGMDRVLADQLAALGTPVWRNEPTYFWSALYQAAANNTTVSLWLAAQPHVRSFGSDAPLPIIGGADDGPYQAPELPKRWSSDPTEANFAEQAGALDELLRAAAAENPQNRCQTVEQYVATFYWSGSAQMDARIQLTEAGFLALATDEGLRYLLNTYPPTQS